MNKKNSFKCPLCCQQSFDCAETLKEHILDVLRKLKCPFCSLYIAELSVLAVHLEECRELKSLQGEDVPMNDENFGTVKREKNVQDEEENEEYTSAETEGDQTQYYCETCNVHFSEMNKHLTDFHLGQEVVVESQDIEDEIETQQETLIEEQTPDEHEQIIVEHEELNEEGKFYTKKLTKINIVPESPTKMIPSIDHLLYPDDAAPEDVDNIENCINDYKRLFECLHCNSRFAQLSTFNKHKCDSSTEIVCEICSLNFTTKAALTNHKRRVHSEEKFGKKTCACDVCLIVFPSVKAMSMHRKMHDPIAKQRKIEAPANYNIIGKKIAEDCNETFTCQICNKEYNTRYEEDHMKSHSEKPYNCAICNRKFADKADLTMHAQAHGNSVGKKFSCGFCKKQSSSEETLKFHMENECHRAKKYSCTFCGRRFVRPHEKVKHERIHTGLKPHICEICGKGFRVSYCLSLHMRTHSGVRPYHCEKCGKRFKSHSVFAHHLQTHSDVRPYKCPFCPKSFKTTVQLAGHKNTHTKPFSCNVCNRPFASLYAVRLHTKSHERQNNLTYQCHICGAIYARKFALRDHILTHAEAGKTESQESD